MVNIIYLLTDLPCLRVYLGFNLNRQINCMEFIVILKFMSCVVLNPDYKLNGNMITEKQDHPHSNGKRKRLCECRM